MDDTTFDAKRRNLLLVTALLCFLKYADASFGKSVSIAAISMSFSRPEAVLHAVWFLWGYFLLRAYQHYWFYLRMDYRRGIQKTIAPLIHPYVADQGVAVEFERHFFHDLERFYKYSLQFRWAEALRGLVALPLRLLAALLLLISGIFVVRRPRSHLKNAVNLIEREPRWRQKLRQMAMQRHPLWVIKVWTMKDRPLEAPGAMEVYLSAERELSHRVDARLFAVVLLQLTLFSPPFFDTRLPFVLALVAPAYWLLG